MDVYEKPSETDFSQPKTKRSVHTFISFLLDAPQWLPTILDVVHNLWPLWKLYSCMSSSEVDSSEPSASLEKTIDVENF